MRTLDELRQTVIEVGNRWPSAGLAVAVVRDGTLDSFIGSGYADGAGGFGCAGTSDRVTVSTGVAS